MGMGTNNNKGIVQLTVSLLYGLPISQMNEICGQLYVSCVWFGLYAANWKVKPDVAK